MANNKPLWHARKLLGLTQAEMARQLGVTQGTYSRYEKAEFEGVALPPMWRLATTQLLQEAGKPIKPEVEQLPIGYTCSVAEYNAMKGQRGHWDRVGSVLTKTAMEAKTSDTNDTADTPLPEIEATPQRTYNVPDHIKRNYSTEE